MSLEEDFKLELQDKLIELKNETQVIKDLLEEHSILYDMNNVDNLLAEIGSVANIDIVNQKELDDNLIMFKNKFKTQFDKIRKSMREIENNMENNLDKYYVALPELQNLDNLINDAIYNINSDNHWINSSIGC